MDEDPQLSDLTKYWLRAQPSVAAYVSASVWSYQDAEDIVQQVAQVCAAKITQFDTNRSFLSWALGIARNEVLRYYRKQDTSREVLSPTALEMVATELSSRESELEDRFAALRECLAKVVGRPKQLLEMRYHREMRPDEIANRLGLTAVAVRVALCRVRQDLGSCISRRLRRQQG